MVGYLPKFVTSSINAGLTNSFNFQFLSCLLLCPECPTFYLTHSRHRMNKWVLRNNLVCEILPFPCPANFLNFKVYLLIIFTSVLKYSQPSSMVSKVGMS